MSAFALLETKTTDGDGAVFTVKEREYSLIRVYGTWDGASVTAYVDFDASGAYCVLASGVWTANDVKQIYFKPGVKVKLTVSSAGGSTSLSAEVL